MKKHASLFWASLISTVFAVAPAHYALADGGVSNAAPAAASSPATPLPLGVTEVVKMYQNGIGQDVLIGYINSSSLPLHLTADGIIYLQHLGLPKDVTTAILRRDGELQNAATAAYQQQQSVQAAQSVTAAPNQTSVVAPVTPAPSVSPYPQVVTVPEPVYPDYSVYPYYGYPYYYGPNVVIGGGWGWGHGWGGHGSWGGHGGGFHGGFHGGGHH